MSGIGGGARWDEDRQRWVTSAAPFPPPPMPPVPPGPPGLPFPTPAPAYPGRRVSSPLMAALAVAAVGVLVAGGLWLAKDDPQPQQPLAEGNTSASTYAEPTDTYSYDSWTTESASEYPTESAVPTLPDGYQAVTDEQGFSLYVPDGWKRVVDGDQVYYTPDNKKKHLIQIGADPAEGRTPYDALQAVETDDLSKRADYQQISFQLTSTDASGPAKLEYSYTNTKSGPRSAIDHAFLTGDGSTIYYVLVAGPSDEWTDTQKVFANVIGSFCDGVDPCSGMD